VACVAEQTSNRTILYKSTQNLYFAKRRDKQIHGVVPNRRLKTRLSLLYGRALRQMSCKIKGERQKGESGPTQIRERSRQHL
jgi:hypothetical protein